MKFLIDECLHTSLVAVANRAGFAATHVNFLGLNGTPDWQLANRVIQEDYTLVTNNRTDFLRLFKGAELHAGLIIIVPNVVPAMQRSLLEAVLVHIGERQLVNAVIETELEGKTIRCLEYSMPLE
jgi:predicted nuclease of predicted toxin-antitoxin system